MDEDKPGHSQSHDPAEESQHAGSSLVSKLARAFSSLPPEQRGAGALPHSTDLVSNPELEDRFQKLLKQVEVLESYQGRRDHKPDPRVVALLEKKIQEMRVGGDEVSDDSGASKAGPAEEVRSVVPSSVQCARCGQSNSAPTPFCGMCGAELAKFSSASDKGSAPAAIVAATRHEPEVPMFPVERETGGRGDSKSLCLSWCSRRWWCSSPSNGRGCDNRFSAPTG